MFLVFDFTITPKSWLGSLPQDTSTNSAEGHAERPNKTQQRISFDNNFVKNRTSQSDRTSSKIFTETDLDELWQFFLPVARLVVTLGIEDASHSNDLELAFRFRRHSLACIPYHRLPRQVSRSFCEKEGRRERERESVCVCVCERERVSERVLQREWKTSLPHQNLHWTSIACFGCTGSHSHIEKNGTMTALDGHLELGGHPRQPLFLMCHQG